MNYNELFTELFTMTNIEDFENFKIHLFDSNLITDNEYQELWKMACDIHSRFVR